MFSIMIAAAATSLAPQAAKSVEDFSAAAGMTAPAPGRTVQYYEMVKTADGRIVRRNTVKVAGVAIKPTKTVPTRSPQLRIKFLDNMLAMKGK